MNTFESITFFISPGNNWIQRGFSISINTTYTRSPVSYSKIFRRVKKKKHHLQELLSPTESDNEDFLPNLSSVLPNEEVNNRINNRTTVFFVSPSLSMIISTYRSRMRSDAIFHLEIPSWSWNSRAVRRYLDQHHHHQLHILSTRYWACATFSSPSISWENSQRLGAVR